MIEGSTLTDFSLFVIMLLSACGAGRILLYLIGIRRLRGKLEYNVLSIGLGVVLFGTAALGIAVSRLLLPVAAAWLLVLISVIGFYGLISPRFKKAIILHERVAAGRRLSMFTVSVAIAFIVFAGFNLVSALVPTLNNDTLNLYFWCPKAWIQQNALSDLKFHYIDNMIFWTPLLHAFTMLLSGEVLAKLFNVYTPGILSALVVFMLARRYFKLEIAILALAVYYNSYCNAWISESGRINFAMAFFELSAMYCFFSWLEAWGVERKRWVLLSGIFAGFAVGTHISSVKTVITVAFLFAVASTWKKRGGAGAALKPLTVFFIAAAVFASPLFIRNYVTTGNPTYPFLNRLFTGQEYEGGVDGLNVLRRAQPTPTPRDFFCKLWDISTKPYWKTRSQTPCVLILAFVPLFFLLRNTTWKIRRLFWVALLLYVLWFFTQRMTRYGYDYLSLLSIVASYTICALIESRRRVVAIAAVCTVFLVFVLDMDKNIRFYHPDGKLLQCALGVLPRRDYLIEMSAKRAFSPNYGLCEFINSNTREEAVVFGTTEVEEYWFDRPYLSVRERAGTDIYREKSPERLLGKMKELGITHVIYSRKYIEAINRWMHKSAIGDDDFYPRDNLFEDKGFQKKYLKKLLEDHTDILYEVRYPVQ